MPDDKISYRISESTGRECQAELKRRGLKQVDIALLAQQSEPTVSQWLKGNRGSGPVYRAVQKLLPDWSASYLPYCKEVYPTGKNPQEENVVPGATVNGCGDAE